MCRFFYSVYILYLLSQADQKHSVAQFMAYVHTIVNEMSDLYLINERRYNYTTPKSFLEQVRLSISCKYAIKIVISEYVYITYEF